MVASAGEAVTRAAPGRHGRGAPLPLAPGPPAV